MIRFALVAWSLLAAPAAALDFTFRSIDGGEVALADWAGRPILVVNTASLCAFTGQYEGLQDLHDRYGPRGLAVLAVPSDDFHQELSSAAEVKEFCELRYDIDLPMTDITAVTGAEAHPFYAWLAREEGFVPRWNFNKVLIDARGDVAGTYGATVGPGSRQLTGAIEALLPD